MTKRHASRLVAVLGVLAFLGCIALMARRIQADLKANPRSFFIFQALNADAFEYAGHHVTLTDAEVSGIPHVKLTYAEQTEMLRVSIPAPRKYQLPGLAEHTDWLRVLRFIDSTGMDSAVAAAKAKAGEIPDRLVIVTKSLRPGVNPETWGEVWKRDWVFDFYELKPDGTIAKEHLGYPTHRQGEAPKPDELKEGSWQYLAALHLMPKGGPTLRFEKSPIESAGWTLPAAALCGIVVLGAIVAGYRRPDEQAAA